MYNQIPFNTFLFLTFYIFNNFKMLNIKILLFNGESRIKINDQ